jgi:hypothetical protein
MALVSSQLYSGAATGAELLAKPQTNSQVGRRFFRETHVAIIFSILPESMKPTG